MEFTRRTIGVAFSWFSLVLAISFSAAAAVSARICAIAWAAPSFPYKTLMACFTAGSEAIIGTIRFLEVRWASSTAMKFNGSAIARYSWSLETRTGTMFIFLARFFGT